MNMIGYAQFCSNAYLLSTIKKGQNNLKHLSI